MNINYYNVNKSGTAATKIKIDKWWLKVSR